MPLSDIVSVQISATADQPTREGFGTPLIASYHSVFSNRVEEYGSLSEITGAGFSVSSPTYKCASAIFSQSPRPPSIKVGRRALAYTQTVHLTCTDATQGNVYNLKIGGQAVTRTVPGSSSTTAEATAIATLINALSISGLTCTSSLAVITLSMTAGLLVDVVPDPTKMTLAELTADPGIATDMAAIIAEDNDWYCLLLDNQGDAEVEAAAAWVESNGKLFLFNSSDSAIATSATNDLFSTLKGSAYTHTAGLFAATQLLCYSAAAWAGKMLPQAPGSENWDFKTLAGIPADNLTTGQIHDVEGKLGSVYTPLSGLNLTQSGNGNVFSGEWLDIIRGIDWIVNEMQVNVLGLLANNQKIPFTDPGIAAIQSTMAGVLQEAIDVGFIASLPKYVINVPLAASVDSIDKGNRHLPGVTFTAPLAGAINSVAIAGTLTL